jgi:hypothetical protein
MKRAVLMALVCVCLLSWCASGLQAGIITFSIATPTVTSSQATFVISAEVMADPGDQVESFQLSIEGNDPLLTVGGTDYSRYTFALDAGTLPGWNENIPVSLAGLGQYSPADPVGGPFFPPTVGFVPIGLMTIDLSGLAGGTSLIFTLANGSPGFNTDAAGVFAGNLIPSMASQLPHEVRFAQPNGVGFQTLQNQPVPEPGSLGLLFACASAVWWRRARSMRRSQPA